jgi:cardiolipin synthase A/B
MTDSPDIQDGNRLTLLETGQAYFPALQAAILGAIRDIFLETYIFQDDPVGRDIAAALRAAAMAGVQVRVLVDGFGSAGFVATLMPELQAAGVEVLVYRREIKPFALRRHRLRRLHRKLAVVDGRIAFVGGINLIDDFDPLAPDHPRHDYAVQVEGPLLAPILDSVERLWRQVRWASLRRRPRPLGELVAETTPAGTSRAAFVIRDNLRHRRDIEDAYLEAIDHAHQDILIANAYFLPGRRFRQALTEAAERGVRVTLLLQGRNEYWLQHSTRALYSHLLASGARLFEYQRSFLHAKVAVVDEAWATVGSSNIDPFSLLLAREANVVVSDAAFAKELRNRLELAMHEGATELCAADWRRRPLLTRAASWLAYNLVRIAIGIAGYGARH